MTQWCSTAVFKVCRRAGVPRDRIMTMRWVLTWKLPDDAVDAADPRRKAKARLVVRDYQDPDILTVRTEAPTVSRIGRNLCY
eukprot:187816-Alexandrium_andersonii.AAC.1